MNSTTEPTTEPTIQDRIKFVLALKGFYQPIGVPQLAAEMAMDISESDILSCLYAIRSGAIKVSGMEVNTVGGKTHAYRTEALPGHRITEYRQEVYDIEAHIRRAFEDVEVGHALTYTEVYRNGRREEIPGSKSMFKITPGEIHARMMHGADRSATIEGIVCNWNTDGILIAYKK